MYCGVLDRMPFWECPSSSTADYNALVAVIFINITRQAVFMRKATRHPLPFCQENTMVHAGDSWKDQLVHAKTRVNFKGNVLQPKTKITEVSTGNQR